MYNVTNKFPLFFRFIAIKIGRKVAESSHVILPRPLIDPHKGNLFWKKVKIAISKLIPAWSKLVKKEVSCTRPSPSVRTPSGPWGHIENGQ
jgi:hypothetical protein